MLIGDGTAGSDEMLERAVTVEVVNTLEAADDWRRAFFVAAVRDGRLAALLERVLAADEAVLEDAECPLACACCTFELVDAPLAECFTEALLELVRGRLVAATTCLLAAPLTCSETTTH